MATPNKFKRKLLIRIGISLGIIFIFVIFIIVLNSDINKRVAAINTYKSQLALQTEVTALAAQLKKNAVAARDKQATLESLLPLRDQLIIFPKEVEKIAKAHKIDFGFSFGNEVAGSGDQPGAVRFTMSLAGTLTNLIAFLKEFETQPYFIKLASVDFSRKNGELFTLLTSGEIYIHP